MLININITEKRPQVDGTPVIVCGNNDYQIRFTFDEEWDHSQMKTARFAWRKGGKALYIDVPFVGDTVDVPMLSEVRFVYVGVYTDHLQTTTPARIACEYSIRCNSGEDIQEPTPENVLIDLFNLVTAQQAEAIESAGIATRERKGATAAAAAAAQSAAAAQDSAKDALKCVGLSTKVLESNSGDAIIFWAGTQAQYDALPEKRVNCLYIITDDTTGADILATCGTYAEVAVQAAAQAGGEAARAEEAATRAQEAADSVSGFHNFVTDHTQHWSLPAYSVANVTQLGSLIAKPIRVEYCSATGLTHFMFYMLFKGRLMPGDLIMLRLRATQGLLPDRIGNTPITSESANLSAYIWPDFVNDGAVIPLIVIRANEEINTGEGEIKYQFSGWFFGDRG